MSTQEVQSDANFIKEIKQLVRNSQGIKFVPKLIGMSRSGFPIIQTNWQSYMVNGNVCHCINHAENI